MSKNHIIAGSLVGLAVVGGSFYAGSAYGKGQTPTHGQGQFAGGSFSGARGAGSARTGSGITAGDILSVDSSSITVKMPNGSTQIVLLGGSTEILKSVAGTAADLSTGVSVMVSGSQNSDGSITAKSIQIRPAGMPKAPTAPTNQ